MIITENNELTVEGKEIVKKRLVEIISKLSTDYPSGKMVKEKNFPTLAKRIMSEIFVYKVKEVTHRPFCSYFKGYLKLNDFAYESLGCPGNIKITILNENTILIEPCNYGNSILLDPFSKKIKVDKLDDFLKDKSKKSTGFISSKKKIIFRFGKDRT